MTMLDRMRRHKGWLKWSLFFVVVAFILLYIPSYLDTPGMPVGANAVVASVDGRDITVDRFRRAYLQQMQAYRNQFGGNMDERLLKQLGIDRRIVQQMIEEEAALAEARPARHRGERRGSARAHHRRCPTSRKTASSSAKPATGRCCRSANPPLRPDEFEDQIRRSIVVEKLQGALTDWITVTDREVEDEFTPPQREGEARRRATSPLTSSATPWRRPTRKSRRNSRRARTTTGCPKSAR